MKKSGQCPKCASHRIAIVKLGAGQTISAGWGGFKVATMHRHVCTDCGFCEWWVANEDDLTRIREYYRS